MPTSTRFPWFKIPVETGTPPNEQIATKQFVNGKCKNGTCAKKRTAFLGFCITIKKKRIAFSKTNCNKAIYERKTQKRRFSRKKANRRGELCSPVIRCNRYLYHTIAMLHCRIRYVNLSIIFTAHLSFYVTVCLLFSHIITLIVELFTLT